MDSCAPQALVAVDISHAAEIVLIEQQGFDHRAPSGQPAAELLLGGVQRVQPQFTEKRFQRGLRHQGQAAEATYIGVAQLAAVIERKKRVRLQRHRRTRVATSGSSGIESRLAKGSTSRRARAWQALHSKAPCYSAPHPWYIRCAQVRWGCS